MDDAELDEKIPEYYVEHVPNIRTDLDVISIARPPQNTDDDALQNRLLLNYYENSVTMHCAAT